MEVGRVASPLVVVDAPHRAVWHRRRRGLYRHTLRGSQDTFSVLLVLGRHGTGQATISVRRGRLADPGPFAERVALLLTPTAHRSPTQIYTDLLDRHELVTCPLRGWWRRGGSTPRRSSRPWRREGSGGWWWA
jgi:hypothetical protein